MKNRKLDQILNEFASATTPAELVDVMSRNVERFGFGAFNFMDISRPDIHEPFNVGSHDPKFIEEYRDNEFIFADPILPIARRRITPFRWSEVGGDSPIITRRSKAGQLMEAAGDYGFKDGLVVPIHYLNQYGLASTGSCVFFWKSQLSKLNFMLRENKHDLHIIATYFTQHLTDFNLTTANSTQRFFNDDNQSPTVVRLTDRERDALAWAARGKTAEETADILKVSTPTINEHLQNAKRKLGGMNKTHTVSIALYHNLIDY